MKTTRGFFLIFFFFSTAVLLPGREVFWGMGRGWNQADLQGLKNFSGWGGEGKALTLLPLGRNPFAANLPDKQKDIADDNIELLLLADSLGIRDAAGRYLISGTAEISRTQKSRGDASLRLRGEGISLTPLGDGLFSPGAVWTDFTWEFRLSPTKLKEGEVLFSWKGRDELGELQEISLRVRKRRLVWTFRNFFTHPGYQGLSVTLESPPLIPGEWRHHLLRFRGTEPSKEERNVSGTPPGLLEYLVDGIPVDMSYSTIDGREGALIFSPQIGKNSSGSLDVGSDFVGYLDELRLTRAFIDIPLEANYTDRLRTAVGLGTTEIIDMGYPDSSVNEVKTLAMVPGDSQISLYISLSNNREEVMQALSSPRSSSWTRLFPLALPDSSGSFQWTWWAPETKNLPSARYWVLRFMLEPDPQRDQAPTLAALTASFQSRLPPQAPQRISVEQQESGTYIFGLTDSPESHITGWWLYWGARPREYVSQQGGSLWIPKTDTWVSGRRRYFSWSPGEEIPSILYLSLRAASSGGEPNTELMGVREPLPQDLEALSPLSQEITYRPISLGDFGVE